MTLVGMKNRPFLRLMVLVQLIVLGAAKADKPAAQYPEHGKVVASRTVKRAEAQRVYTDPYGKTHGGARMTCKISFIRLIRQIESMS